MFNSKTNCLSFFGSMAAANVVWIDYTQPGPIDNSVLSQQAKHRSKAIWNGRVKHNSKYLLVHMHLIHTMYTYLLSYINPWFYYVQDPGSITCRSRSSEFSKQPPVVDDRVRNIINTVGLEGLLWVPDREIGNGLITALVER